MQRLLGSLLVVAFFRSVGGYLPPWSLPLPLVCVDHGLLRTGIALTRSGFAFEDFGIVTASEEDVSEDSDDGGRDSEDRRRNRRRLTGVTEEILRCCRLVGARGVVVGLPLLKDGAECVQTRIVREFCEKQLLPGLSRDFGGTWDERGTSFRPNCPLFLFDERYSSSVASASLSGGDGKRWVTTGLDAVSACFILSHFCKSKGKGREELFMTDRDTVTWALSERDNAKLNSASLQPKKQSQESREDMIRRIQQEELASDSHAPSRKAKELMKKKRRKSPKKRVTKIL